MGIPLEVVMEDEASDELDMRDASLESRGGAKYRPDGTAVNEIPGEFWPDVEVEEMAVPGSRDSDVRGRGELLRLV